uniref:hypothetical protein n=1 Tax=Candidatus Ventrenecus sp. TaxID=3085654 RepID=UPI003FF06AD8
MKDISENLKELEIEDFIWVISLFSACFALLSNKLEKDYLYTHNLSKEKEYKTINITLLVIAFFIYLYFMMLNYKRIKRNTHQSFKQMRINNANFLAATLIVLATIIYIMTSILSTNELEILP